jgi:hypothetical protein
VVGLNRIADVTSPLAAAIAEHLGPVGSPTPSVVKQRGEILQAMDTGRNFTARSFSTQDRRDMLVAIARAAYKDTLRLNAMVSRGASSVPSGAAGLALDDVQAELQAILPAVFEYMLSALGRVAPELGNDDVQLLWTAPEILYRAYVSAQGNKEDQASMRLLMELAMLVQLSSVESWTAAPANA